MIALQQQGWSQTAIRRETELVRKTIRRYLRAGTFRNEPRRSAIERLIVFCPIWSSWVEGCHNAAQLWREIAEQGYPAATA